MYWYVISLFLVLWPSFSFSVDVLFERKIVDTQNPKDPWIKIVGDLTGDGFTDLIVGGQNGPLVYYSYPDWKKTRIGTDQYHTVVYP